jgi:hypothetical protein
MEIANIPDICGETCGLRLKLGTPELEQLLGSTVAEACNRAAVELVLGGTAIEQCPYWQYVNSSGGGWWMMPGTTTD